MARTRSQAGKYAKGKGNRYEDKCSKLWSTWFYDDIATLRRFGNMSGGHFKHSAKMGRARIQNIQYVGDFGNIDDPKSVPFCWECKDWKTFEVKKFLHCKPNWEAVEIHKSDNPLGWWEETVSDAYAAKKIPVLLATTQYQPDYIVINQTLWGLLCRLYEGYYHDLLPYKVPHLIRYLDYLYHGEGLEAASIGNIRRRGGPLYIFDAKDMMALDATFITENFEFIRERYQGEVYASGD